MAKVTQLNSRNFIGTYPEKTEGIDSIPLVLFIGGITTRSYALKESLVNITPENIKRGAIFVYGNIGSKITDMAKYGEQLAKKSGFTISDNKLLLFSGGAEKAILSLNAVKLSMIGMIDPTPLQSENFRYISGYQNIIRMIYKPGEWKLELANRQEKYADFIIKGGGKASRDDSVAHRNMPDAFFRLFGSEVIKPFKAPEPEPIQQQQVETTEQLQVIPDESGFQPPPPSTPAAVLNPTINSAAVGELMKQMEKLSINDEEDVTVKTIDPETTVEGFLKYLIEKEHRENFLKDDEELIGTVFRIPRLYTDTNYSYQQIASVLRTSPREFMYKVRIHKLDSNFGEIPETYDGTQEDIEIINKYRDFLAPSNLKLKVGDTVSVMLGDQLRMKNGMIVRRIPESSNDIISPPQAAYGSESGIMVGSPIINGNFIPGARSLVKPFNFNDLARYPNLKFDNNVKLMNDSFPTFVSKAAPYVNYVVKIARIYGIPPNLIMAFISAESAWDPDAVSRAKAVGLSQFTTAAYKTVTGFDSFRSVYISEGEGEKVVDRRNPKHSIILCCSFVKFLLERFNGDVEKSASGYNTGPWSPFLQLDDWKANITSRENSDYVVRVPYLYIKFSEIYPEWKD